MSDKTNLQHLKDILAKIQKDDCGEEKRNELFEEANEFVESAEEEIVEKNRRIDDINDEKKDLEKRVEEFEEDGVLQFNEEDLGLDRLYWQLKNGNLKLTGEVESFINRLKKAYMGVTS